MTIAWSKQAEKHEADAVAARKYARTLPMRTQARKVAFLHAKTAERSAGICRENEALAASLSVRSTAE